MQLKHFAKRICLVSKYVLVFGMKNRAGMNDFRNQLESTYMWRLNAKMHANHPYTISNASISSYSRYFPDFQMIYHTNANTYTVNEITTGNVENSIRKL